MVVLLVIVFKDHPQIIPCNIPLSRSALQIPSASIHLQDAISRSRVETILRATTEILGDELIFKMHLRFGVVQKIPESRAVGSMNLIFTWPTYDMISNPFYLSKSVAPALILPSRTQSWEVCFDSVVLNLLRQYMTSASHVGHINRQPLWGFESFQKAKDNLKAFQVQMRRWLDGCWHLCHSWTLAPFHWNTGWTYDAASQLSFSQPTIPFTRSKRNHPLNSTKMHQETLKHYKLLKSFVDIPCFRCNSMKNHTGLFGTPSRPCGACSLPEMEGYGQAPQRHGRIFQWI